MFWCGYAASADSLGSIRELGPLNLENSSGFAMVSSQVTLDAAGHFHIVFEDAGGGVWYSASEDAGKWAPPARLPVEVQGFRTRPAELMIDGARVALIYCKDEGAWLMRSTLEKLPKFGPAIKITNHVVPLTGSRATVTADGEVLLLAGGDTLWLLRADLKQAAFEPSGD
jgi:hypothetical protein